eukprot:scaffold269954_cov16-Prasinocladus_malaysianus.AAC.2
MNSQRNQQRRAVSVFEPQAYDVFACQNRFPNLDACGKHVLSDQQKLFKPKEIVTLGSIYSPEAKLCPKQRDNQPGLLPMQAKTAVQR